jgi:hypothetical protein
MKTIKEFLNEASGTMSYKTAIEKIAKQTYSNLMGGGHGRPEGLDTVSMIFGVESGQAARDHDKIVKKLRAEHVASMEKRFPDPDGREGPTYDEYKSMPRAQLLKKYAKFYAKG